MSSKEAYARATAMLERVGLADRCDSFPSQLSGGERRRVAIARALINSPELLLADEPTADLDEQTESEILDLLIDIHRALNITLVVVTHNPDIAARADQLIEMRSGRIVSAETRAPQQVLPGISKDIFAVSAESTKSASVRLGQGIERMLGKMVLLAVPAVATVAALNYGVESYEQGVLAEKAAQRMALEEVALSDLRADVKSITFGPDNSYTVNLYLRNAKGESPIYVMSPSVRAFVQVGTSWQEIPIEPKGKSVPQVSKITDENIFSFSIKPDITDFAQLIPYYMHVRLTNDMLVSPSDKPKGELIERSDSYYVYLKPHNANDSAILTKLKFPGEPPVWIPMPPH
jgi:putative ABC transport system ATP-binding protein/macrolide transport system ATP-binding/permease protein/lipoprotein-releasing system ATP-binding protein